MAQFHPKGRIIVYPYFLIGLISNILHIAVIKINAILGLFWPKTEVFFKGVKLALPAFLLST